MSFSPNQAKASNRDVAAHPAMGVVCPDCGSRVGKPCVSTVPTLGIGVVGAPIEGVHAKRIVAAREEGLA